ncbi:hypothetical protein KGV55_02135 [Candidatus Gracilibacteria bacterium]|nr:hypothetical protein [Candidatus Gracilibacteria bacterium]
MQSTISKILKEINEKKQELSKEYDKIKEKYDFEFIKGKIIFSDEQKQKYKKEKKSIFDTIFTAQVREILSIPFIYGMIIPFIVLDIFLFVYQNTAMRLYKIPLAKRKDYVVFDRKFLGYLNVIEKINCLYCSYGNGLLAYAREVAARTERYWCPIKHAKKRLGSHNWEQLFADYGDSKGFRELYSEEKNYEKEIEITKENSAK